MSPQEKDMLDMHFKELTKDAVNFLEGEGSGCKNEHGAYCYESANGKHLIALDMYLTHFKQYLIDNNIVKEVD